MRCPACQSPLTENDAACRQCGFSLEAADRALGIPPALEKPLTDPQRLLTRLARSRVERRITDLQRRHPQISIAIVLMNAPQQVPPALYAFWLFNRGQLSSIIDQGGANHVIMLFVDSASSRAVAMMGYGLEPFFPQSQLQLCLNVFAQQMQRAGLAEAIEAFIAELDAQLRHIHLQLPRIFGLTSEDHWHDSTEDPGSQGYTRAPERIEMGEF